MPCKRSAAQRMHACMNLPSSSSFSSSLHSLSLSLSQKPYPTRQLPAGWLLRRHRKLGIDRYNIENNGSRSKKGRERGQKESYKPTFQGLMSSRSKLSYFLLSSLFLLVSHYFPLPRPFLFYFRLCLLCYNMDSRCGPLARSLPPFLPPSLVDRSIKTSNHSPSSRGRFKYSFLSLPY